MQKQKNSSKFIVVGFDPGYGNTKVAYVNGKLTQVSLPSVVGVGHTDLGLLGRLMTPQLGRRRRETPDETQFDGASYLVGENVASFARPVERMDFQRLSDGPELRALFYTAMHRLLGTGTHSDIRVMVGLPVEVMTNRPLALATRRSLRNWMMGQHTVTVSGATSQLLVTRVEVLAQPSGSYFAWGMNENGGWQLCEAHALRAPQKP